jgi:hypothetical protein
MAWEERRVRDFEGFVGAVKDLVPSGVMAIIPRLT